MKPPVEAPTSSARRPADVQPERVERVGELDAAARDVRRRARRPPARRPRPPAGPAWPPGERPGPDVHVAGEHRRGGTRAGREQAALRQQAVEPDPGHRRHKVTVIHFTVDGTGVQDHVGVMIRRLSLTEHGLLELLAGLALIGAPLVLGLGPVALMAGVGGGALIAGLGLADGMPISAHMAADLAIGARPAGRRGGAGRGATPRPPRCSRWARVGRALAQRRYALDATLPTRARRPLSSARRGDLRRRQPTRCRSAQRRQIAAQLAGDRSRIGSRVAARLGATRCGCSSRPGGDRARAGSSGALDQLRDRPGIARCGTGLGE